MKTITREQWLTRAGIALERKFFKANGYDLPEKIRVSCGFPRGSSKAIGQCWDTVVSADETYEIFICPTQAEPIRVLDILLHELIHASVGIKAGHKGPFRKLAKEFGLEGKMTATAVTAGSELHGRLAAISEKLGDYPHAAMTKKRKPTKLSPWVRFMSEVDPSYKVIVDVRRLDDAGVPNCPWNKPMVVVPGPLAEAHGLI